MIHANQPQSDRLVVIVCVMYVRTATSYTNTCLFPLLEMLDRYLGFLPLTFGP